MIPERRRASARGARWLAVVACLIVPAVAPLSAARANEQPYVHEGFVFRGTAAARYNPLGLSASLRFGYRHPLLRDQDNPVLQSTYAGIDAIGAVTPAYARGGIRVDLQPLAVFRVLVSYEAIGLFGTFDSAQSYPNVSADFSDAAQAARAREGLSYATTGRSVTINPTLQGRVGRWTLVSSTELVHNEMKVRRGDTVYYDLPYGMLAPSAGWLLGNETELLLAIDGRISVGLHHGVYHAFFPDRAIAGDVARAREITPIECLGPVLLYQPSRTNGPGRLKNPLFFVATAWWLRNPYRTGVEVSRAIPYVFLGFTFEGDLRRAARGG